MSITVCPHCGFALQINLAECPRCGKQVGFPNVTAAASPEETAALDARLQAARDDLRARGATARADEFTQKVDSAEAVINRYFGELFRLAFCEDQVYATYYQRVQAGLQLPESDEWNRLRGIADEIIFGFNKPSIRFAALSMDGTGLDHYGDCSMTLARTAITHRASVFEENTVVFTERHDLRGQEKFKVPPGYRATWERRIDLCLAKLAGRLESTTPPGQFAAILLSAAMKPQDDAFVEVHIWGPLVMGSFQRVVVRKWALRPSKAEKLAVRKKIEQLGLELVCP